MALCELDDLMFDKVEWFPLLWPAFTISPFYHPSIHHHLDSEPEWKIQSRSNIDLSYRSISKGKYWQHLEYSRARVCQTRAIGEGTSTSRLPPCLISSINSPWYQSSPIKPAVTKNSHSQITPAAMSTTVTNTTSHSHRQGFLFFPKIKFFYKGGYESLEFFIRRHYVVFTKNKVVVYKKSAFFVRCVRFHDIQWCFKLQEWS